MAFTVERLVRVLSRREYGSKGLYWSIPVGGSIVFIDNSNRLNNKTMYKGSSIERIWRLTADFTAEFLREVDRGWKEITNKFDRVHSKSKARVKTESGFPFKSNCQVSFHSYANQAKWLTSLMPQVREIKSRQEFSLPNGKKILAASRIESFRK